MSILHRLHIREGAGSLLNNNLHMHRYCKVTAGLTYHAGTHAVPGGSVHCPCPLAQLQVASGLVVLGVYMGAQL